MHGRPGVDDQIVLDHTSINSLEPAFDVGAVIAAGQFFESMTVEHRGLTLLTQAFDHLPLAGEEVHGTAEVLELSLNLTRIATDALAQIGVTDHRNLVGEEVEQLCRV